MASLLTDAQSPYGGTDIEEVVVYGTTEPDPFTTGAVEETTLFDLASYFVGALRAARLGVTVGRGVIAARGGSKIVARNGTEITGFTRHGINRAIGDGASRAGVKPQAVLDALKNPGKIVDGVDDLGRPFQVFHGANARVVVNPKTGQIVSMNPLSGAGAH